MPSLTRLGASLLTHARVSEDIAVFRTACLETLRPLVGYDAALFHELSPRVPLSRGAMVGLDPARVVESSARWDDNAVVLGRLREVALASGGVATDGEAFPDKSRGRTAFVARVARPLGVRSLLIAHLVVFERIISAVLLFRSGADGFRAEEAERMRKLVPALAVGDALQQLATASKLGGATTRLRCVDQRLTRRQREIVERVALGHTNRHIGEALSISENTVRNLLVVIRRKLDVANRAELVRVAVFR